MLEQFSPFVPALIWGFTPIFYRQYIARIGSVRLNLLRTIFASIALFFPFLVYGFNGSIIFGSVSGFLTLALGDTLFFVSVGLVGASVATPLLYIQTILIQLFATRVGEPLSPLRLSSAVLIVGGVYLLSRGGDSPTRLKGIIIGLAAALLEAFGQTSIKLATSANINPLSIAFSRSITAAPTLGIILLLKERKEFRRWPLKKMDYLILSILSVGDIAFAASIFIYAIGLTGIVFATIILGVSPLITQVGSKAMRRESARPTDFLAGLLIVIAIATTLL